MLSQLVWGSKLDKNIHLNLSAALSGTSREDSDCVVPEDWIVSLIGVMDDNECEYL